jgi:hypothetical protein
MAQLHAKKVVIFGGRGLRSNQTAQFLGDTWFLSVAKEADVETGVVAKVAIWESVTRGSYSWPESRMHHAMESMGNDKVLLYGGCKGDSFHTGCVTFFFDLWMFVIPVGEQGTWISIDANYQRMRSQHSMAYLKGSMVVFGGIVNSIHGSTRSPSYGGDTWTIANGCPEGYYDDGHGCEMCKKGNSNNQKDPFSACVPCPSGLTTSILGATSINMCNMCKHWGFGECKVEQDENTKKLTPQWTCVPWAWGSHCQYRCKGFLQPNHACNKRGVCNNNPNYAKGKHYGKCECDDGFTGDACQFNCLPHGDSDPFHLTCTCDSLYFGKTCKNDSSCSLCDQKCTNGKASNISLGNNFTGASYPSGCDCQKNDGTPSEFYGPKCESTCWNGGVAHIVHTTRGKENKLDYCQFSSGLIVTIVTLFFLVCAVFFVYKYYTKKVKHVTRNSEMKQAILRKEWQQDLSMVNEGWRIDDSDLQWNAKLADGAFGSVWRGVWHRFPGSYVAIKIIKFVPRLDSGGDNPGDHAHLGGAGVEGKNDTKKRNKKKEQARRAFSLFTKKGGGGGGGDPLEWQRRERGSKSEGDGSRMEDHFQVDVATGAKTDTAGSGDSNDDWVDKEIAVLMRTRHPRVVLFLGGGRLQTTGEIFLVSEFMQGGDLRQVLADRHILTGKSTMEWSHRLQAAYDIAEGMQFLHSKNLIHRDL